MAPISLVIVVTQTNPFFISIFSYFMLREPIVGFEIIGMVVCFSAVVAIATQQIYREQEAEDEMLKQVSDEPETKGEPTLLGLTIALVSAVVAALCAVLNRALKEIPTPIILFYHSIGGLTLAIAYIAIEALVTK